jgi:hypothetical protein
MPEGYADVSRGTGAALALVLPALYTVSVGVRTLGGGRAVTPFEAFQSAAALLLGLSQAARILATPAGPMLAGAVALLVGAAFYTAAAQLRSVRGRADATVHWYAAVAPASVLSGTLLLLSGTRLAATLSLLALVSLALGRWRARRALAWHGLAYLVTAAAAGGLLAAATDGLVAGAAGRWRPLTPAALGLLGVAVLAYGIVALPSRAGRSAPPDHAAALIALLLGWSLAGVLARAGAVALGIEPGVDADAAAVATLRSAVLAGLALACAWAKGRCARAELGWMAQAFLVLAGAKLLFEDLRQGRPATLFLSLTLLGGALLAAPRLMRSRR